MNVAHIRRIAPDYPVFGTDLSKSATMSLHSANDALSMFEIKPMDDQAVSVLSGVLTAENDFEEAELSEGDTLLVPAGITHRFRSKSREAVLAVSVYRPQFESS